MIKSHNDLSNLFPAFYLELPKHQQQVLCKLYLKVGFLGLVSRRALIICIKRKDHYGVCQHLKEFPDLCAEYLQQ